MATHKSAEKRARQTVKRTERNTGLRQKLKSTIRVFREAMTGGDKAKIETAYLAATRELRRAATKGIIPKRTASRRVSRLSLAINNYRAPAPVAAQTK